MIAVGQLGVFAILIFLFTHTASRNCEPRDCRDVAGRLVCYDGRCQNEDEIPGCAAGNRSLNCRSYAMEEIKEHSRLKRAVPLSVFTLAASFQTILGVILYLLGESGETYNDQQRRRDEILTAMQEIENHKNGTTEEVLLQIMARHYAVFDQHIGQQFKTLSNRIDLLDYRTAVTDKINVVWDRLGVLYEDPSNYSVREFADQCGKTAPRHLLLAMSTRLLLSPTLFETINALEPESNAFAALNALRITVLEQLLQLAFLFGHCQHFLYGSLRMPRTDTFVRRVKAIVMAINEAEEQLITQRKDELTERFITALNEGLIGFSSLVFESLENQVALSQEEAVKVAYDCDTSNFEVLKRLLYWLKDCKRQNLVATTLLDEMKTCGHFDAPEIFLIAYLIKERLAACSEHNYDWHSHLLPGGVHAILWDDHVHLENRAFDMVLDNNKKGEVYTHQRNTGKYQIWHMTALDEGSYFTLKNRKTRRTVCADGEEVVGVNLEADSNLCHWIITPTDEGQFFWLKNRETGGTLQAGRRYIGQPGTVSAKSNDLNNGHDQHWRIY